MKKIIAFLLSILVMSCSNDEQFDNYNTEKDNETVVNLSFSPYTMEPMMRASTRAAINVADVVSHLDIFLVEGDNVIDIHQTSTSENFCSVNVTLNKTKTYTLYAVAHNSSNVATLNEGVISFPDDAISDSFYYTTSFTPTSSSLSCVMNRIVGKFSIWMTDEIPDNVASFEITASTSGKKLNVDGTPADTGARTKTFTSWSSAASGTMLSMYVIPLDMTTTNNMTFTVTAYNSSSQVVETKTFSNVTMRVGYKTMYKGNFFTSNALTMTFTSIDWNSYDTVNF